MPDAVRALIGPAPDGVLLLDRQDRVVALNPAARTMLGLDRLDVEGRQVEDVLGEGHDAIEIVAATLDGPGSIRGARYLRDLSRERALEAALADSDAVVSTVRDAMIETDADFNVVSWNRAAEQMYGWSAAEVVGRRVNDLLQTQLPEDELAHMRATLDEMGHVLTLVRQRTRAGGVIEVEASVIALPDASGGLSGYVAVNRDVSGRRRLEDRLRETRHLEMVGRLAAGVAHDLNSQLTAIMGYAELTLADRGLPEHVRPDVQQILRAAERSGELTGQLLAFSRQQVLTPRPVDLDAVVAATVAARRRLVGPSVELVDRSTPGLAQVLVDPLRLQQALLDVVANAADAMPSEGRLVTTSALIDADGSDPQLPAGRYARLEVADTGSGMDAETRSRAFEPFFTTKPGHTGLGLSTLYGFVGQSGGHVTLDSAAGSGTTVGLYLRPAESLTRG